jgi:hypothetical protein
VEGLLIDPADSCKPLIKSMDKVAFDSMLLDLIGKFLKLGDEFLNGVGEGGGNDSLNFYEMEIDFILESGTDLRVLLGFGLLPLTHSIITINR